MIGRIGEGRYGTVYKIESAPPHRIRVCKCIRSDAESKNGVPISAYRECSVSEKQAPFGAAADSDVVGCGPLSQIMQELCHPNIICVENILIRPSPATILIVMEYAPYDLDQILNTLRRNPIEKSILPLSAIRVVMHSVLSALSYLHAQWIMHRDLKPGNMLVVDGRIKLADFSLARCFRYPVRPFGDDGTVVTQWYRAPELLLDASDYSEAIGMCYCCRSAEATAIDLAHEQ